MAKIVQSFTADINGDGVLDFITVDSDHRWTALNGKTGRTDDIPTFPPAHQVPGWPCWGRYFFADFTGNKIADRAYYSPDGNWFVIDQSSGGPGVPGVPWGSSIPGWPGNGRISVADFNGDGKAERCYLTSDGNWHVVNSDGSPGIPGIPWGQKIPGWPGDGHYIIADFNGDGGADRAFVHPDGGWYVVNSRSGAGGLPSMPWGHKIPGWPGGGRYLCLDFNNDGIVDRCFVHPDGRCYIVDSASGAPMGRLPELGGWGDYWSGVSKIVLDVIMFEATAIGCAYSLGANWLACMSSIAQGYRVYTDINDMMQTHREREQKVNKQRDREYRPDREPYLRTYPPKSDTPPGTELKIGELKIRVEKDCDDRDVDCPRGSVDRETPDRYHEHLRPRGDLESFDDPSLFSLELGKSPLLTMVTSLPTKSTQTEGQPPERLEIPELPPTEPTEFRRTNA
jgi:hypothetical protein